MSKEVYQMRELKRAKPNRFKPGITAQEHFGTNKMHNTGIPVQGFKGVPKDRGLGSHPTGVPIPGTGKVSPRLKEAGACSATTKKGEPCKAAPITDTDLCIGHTRQRG